MTNNQVEQVLVGSILGDGSIDKFMQYRERHCLRQKDYLLWKKRIFIKQFKRAKMKYYIKNGCDLYIPKHSIFEEYRKISYPNGKKRITKEIIDKIDKLAIVVWYFDDGSYNPISNSISIFSMSFSYKENRKLQRMLKDRFGFNFRIYCDRNHYFLYCSGENTDNFLNLIKRNALYIPKSMTYKMGKFHRGNMKWIEENKKAKKNKDKFYYYKNKKRIKKRVNKYYWKKLKEIRKKQAEYYQNNKEKFKKYRENNKGYYLEYNRKYHRKNREYFIKYMRKWHKKNIK